MKNIYFNLNRIEEENEKTYLCSKILGTPVFPENFLLNGNGKCILGDADYFIMQLNLEDIADKIRDGYYSGNADYGTSWGLQVIE